MQRHLGTLGAAAWMMLMGGCTTVYVVAPRAAPVVMSHPGLATSEAVFLQLYRTEQNGLLVGGLYPNAPVDPDRNPATVLHRFTFTADPSVRGSYLWAFADGVTYLDGTCGKTDLAGLLAAAGRPGHLSVEFMDFLRADKSNWAPPAVHVFNHNNGEPTDCRDTVLTDPAFAHKAQQRT